MGLDQSIVAVSADTHIAFPMLYQRKNYELNEQLINKTNADTGDCYVDIELTKELIDFLARHGLPLYMSGNGTTSFWKYLQWHSAYWGDEFKYYYQADW